MTSIILKLDEDSIEKIELIAGEYRIGRSEDNDISILNPTVSSHHAKIFTYLNSAYIEDLNSSNGTWINGKRVQKHTIHPGDEIKLGQQLLQIDF